MDSFENPRLVKRPSEDSAEAAKPTEDNRTRPGDSESQADPNAGAQPVDEARREKIEKLKKAVADGTYHVSDEEVARKLIDHMLEPKE
jgi:anti-sigma28 factor (negative regulator of flagellin synthesis)